MSTRYRMGKDLEVSKTEMSWLSKDGQLTSHIFLQTAIQCLFPTRVTLADSEFGLSDTLSKTPLSLYVKIDVSPFELTNGVVYDV